MDRAAWPPALEGTPVARTIENAIARRRLSHSLLLHGDDPAILAQAARVMADRLLRPPGDPVPFPPETHPDCFILRPGGKSRQISAESTRDLIGQLQVSPAVAPVKVAIIQECDRMHVAAANIFLKTLEEPPPRTMLLLLTTRPYALLPTIRSRTLHFRFPTAATPVAHPDWAGWTGDYTRLLGGISAGLNGQFNAADAVFLVYGLLSRFNLILEAAGDAAWQEEKKRLAVELTDAEEEALQAGITNGLRDRMFAEIERATRDFAVDRLGRAPDPQPALVAAVRRLEQDAGLLRLNLNTMAALEDFLLASLRIWTSR